MKIDLKLAGSAEVEVDFTTLRAALIAAQAATPTARAALQQRPDGGSVAFGGCDLFAGTDRSAAGDTARALHSFTARVPAHGDEA